MAGEILKVKSLKDAIKIEKEIKRLKKEGRPEGLAIPLATFEFDRKKEKEDAAKKGQ